MKGGLIAWFARNGVAANLLLCTILGVGALSLWQRTILEVFPEFDQDRIDIRMSYRGAAPTEVEEGVVVKIEEAIQDLVGIKEILSTASEGSGQVSVEVESGYDPRELLDDIKNRVDAINTFPDETERPVFSVAQRRREVMSVVLYGSLTEKELRRQGEEALDELNALPGVTQVVLTEVRPYEISVEVSEEALQRYGLSIDQVVSAIRRSSLDMPGGSIKSEGGEILLRTKGQAYVREEFERLVVVKREDGTQLTVGQIAKVIDGFEEEPLRARFNGQPCVMLEVYRVGDQNAMALAETVKAYVLEKSARLPAGVQMTWWRDRSTIIEKRMQTLFKSAAQGGILVLVLLALFLRPWLAFWVCMGIPVSFMGALAVLPEVGITINIISLFAFIMVLGIVVDDAIVTGENIYTHLRRGMDPTEAAIKGTQEVAIPVTFGVLTTIVAFIPLTMLGGRRGPIFAQIPYVVIPALIFSLIESKFVLPSHLKHIRPHLGREGPLARFQGKVADGLEYLVHTFYQPLLDAALRWRYLTMAGFVGVLVLVVSTVLAGYIRFFPFPKVASETAQAALTMPLGTPFEVTDELIQRINEGAEKLREKYIDPTTGKSIIRDILATSGSSGRERAQSHIGRVMFEILPPEDRSLKLSSTELVREWRKMIGPLPGARDLNFRAEIGRSSDPIDIQLAGNNLEDLRRVANKVKDRLAVYPAVFDITDSFEQGKAEVKLRIKPEAELLGLSMADLGRQVRQGFFGAEALRIQRGREDVRVMVRYPKAERSSLGHLESMLIRTPEGVEVPFSEVAEAQLGKSFSSIIRKDRRRTINITADVDKESANVPAIQEEMNAYVAALVDQHAGVSFSFEGEAREQRESFEGLIAGLIFTLFSIYALLAIPFKDYLQPLIVMSVIPFGIVGAVLGHFIMGMNLSLFSIFGLLALTGIVVNDSLVMVDYINRRRQEGTPLQEAVRTAGVARFRAILLTTLTTFAGLMPLIFEKSTQAQFLIPMAVSLGFGVLFATLVTLFLVPVNYILLEDSMTPWRTFKRWMDPAPKESPEAATAPETFSA